MSNDVRDDDAWFDALSGRGTGGADAATSLEASLLRGAARRWPTQVPEEDVKLNPAQTAALLARAEALQRGHGKPICAGCAARWRLWRERLRWPAAWGLGFAALVMSGVLAIHFATLAPPAGVPPEAVLRAPVNGVWLLRDADPRARRDRIATDIETQGVAVQRYEFVGRYGLDADLHPPLAPGLANAMKRHGLEAGADGSLRVEVEQARP